MGLETLLLLFFTLGNLTPAQAVAVIRSNSTDDALQVDPRDFHCVPPVHASRAITYGSCRSAVSSFTHEYRDLRGWSLTHRRHLRLPGEISCPHIETEYNCQFKLDYSNEGFFNPPARIEFIGDLATRLARACVGPNRGNGGTFELAQDNIRGPWKLKFEFGPVESSEAKFSTVVDSTATFEH